MQKNGNKLGKRKQTELMGPNLPTGPFNPQQDLSRGLPADIGLVGQQQVVQSYQGPIPSPDMLAEYEKLQPGLADRLVRMAEGQSLHRQELERTSAKRISDDAVASRRERRWGQVIGGIVVLASLGASVAISVWGQGQWTNASAGAVGSIPLVGLVLVFMTGKKNGDGRAQPKPAPTKTPPSD